MFGLTTTAKLLDCEVSNIRALENNKIVKISPYGYTYVQLVLMRVILLIKKELNYGSFKFAKIFIEHKIKFNFNDVLIYSESGLQIYPDINESEINEWLMETNREIYVDEVNEKIPKLINKTFGLYACKEKSFILIPLCRVFKYIDRTAESMGLTINLVNAKQTNFDEKGILTSVSN